MDMASIGSLLTSVKTATDIANFIRKSDVSIEKAETKLELANLISALADVKIEAAGVQQILLDRDEEIRNLKQAAKTHAELRWEQPCYYKKNEQNVDEPFCQKCYDDEKKISRLHADGDGCFQCRVCKHSYKTKERIGRETARTDAALNKHARNDWRII